MLRYLSAIFLLLLFIASCKQPKSEETPAEKAVASADKTFKPIIVVHRAKQKFTEAKKPASNKVIAPQVFPANANVIPVDDLTAAGASPLKIVTPGTDTLGLPKTVTVSPKITVCRQPVPVKALPPRFKDAAISDIQYLNVEQGLSQSSIKSVITDRSGNIWIGTDGGGVSRYDGRSFLHFTKKNGLGNNTVLNIFQDSKGNIWLGTEGGGACCYDGEYFISITEDEGLGSNTVLSIGEDKEGNIWFGTNGGGVSRYDGKSLTTWTEKEGLSHSVIRSILRDSKGNMWFGTQGAGACMFDGKSFNYLGENEGLNSTIIHAMIEDKQGRICFASEDGGVNIYDGKTVKYITAKRGLSSNCIVSLHEDRNGNLWIGTYDSGLCKYDGKEITIYSTSQGLTNNYILAISEDNSGSLWLGTMGGGICRFNTGSFTHYTEKEGLGKNTVRSISLDKDGNLWLGTFGDGAIYYDGKSFKHFTDKNGLPSNRVMATVIDNDNNVWFGTEENGVAKYNGSSFEIYTTEQGLHSDYILSMCKDKEGRIWFGTNEEGVSYFDGKQFVSFIDEEGLSNGIIRSIMQDRNGNIWFGTEGSGACCYDGKFLKWYSAKTGLGGNDITCMSQDNAGNLWFGTEGDGISVLTSQSMHSKEPEFRHITEKDGLSHNSIRSIMQDKSGNVWIATERGLNYLINKPDSMEVHVYTSSDGLKDNKFFSSVVIDKKNTIWWGNNQALTNLDLDLYKLPQESPVIQLNSIELEKSFIDFYLLRDTLKSGKTIIVGKEDRKDLKRVKFEGVEKFYNYPKSLVLPHDINQVEFSFSAIDWAGADKIQYEYMLSGSDDEDWSPLSPDNKVSYNNLSNGDYVFKVKAIGISGKWSTVFEYPFAIKPPWYRTFWAYALYVVAFFGVVVGFNNIRTRQLKIRQQELEQTVAERTAEVVEQKELIEEKQKEILDSINYAKRIQSAMLASDHLFSKNLKNYFVLFQPKDIVSGDFYWASPLPDGRFALVTADSTGHGVPGAMMSMLNISCLNEAINERKITSPAEILNHARQRIISSLAEDGSEEGGKDGMDCSVLVFDFKNRKLSFAAANNPVWIVRPAASSGAAATAAAELIELKPDRMPVGKHAKDTISFTEQTIDLLPGDTIYALTDGMPDQFGGPRAKKFTYKRLKEIFMGMYIQNGKEQREQLEKAFKEWKGTLEQVDDVLIIGVKI
jgi:ligand-binding sensor domain-containing protein/serine phosphatase RsbU (regulator of sigma subunit)